MKYSHIPVLLQAACDFLEVIPGGLYIDATLGRGGHTQEIIKRGGKVLGLDQDPESLTACPDLDGLTKVHSNFSHISEVARNHGFSQCDGVLFDFGVSSPQIDNPVRGFSFQKDGPLDMRMDPNLVMTAADLINTLPAKQLANIFFDYGQISGSRALAEKIVAKRPFTSTAQLAQVTSLNSRQAFQALRIAVNDELGSIKLGLVGALEVLKPGGVIVAISFHSLEDKIVKEFFQESKGQILTQMPVSCKEEEIKTNPRCKSAKLRSFKKI